MMNGWQNFKIYDCIQISFLFALISYFVELTSKFRSKICKFISIHIMLTTFCSGTEPTKSTPDFRVQLTFHEEQLKESVPEVLTLGLNSYWTCPMLVRNIGRHEQFNKQVML